MTVLDIFGKTDKNNNFVLELPETHDVLESELAVKKIIIEWKSSAKFIGFISTDLVWSNPGNYRGQICSFIKQPNTLITEYDFSDPCYYKLKHREITYRNKINIEPMYEDFVPAIKFAYIQLITE